jgi:hypothetical protein
MGKLSSSIPQVLARAAIPRITAGWDASDVLECYYLTRRTFLHGLANSTIPITKVALGIRYRPPAALSAVKHKVLELTLEYGPSRAGPDSQHESIPRVVPDDDGAFVSWDNEAKVYYTTEIDASVYMRANYLASLSGAILAKLLQEALDFVEASRHRRYQPFAVYAAVNPDEEKIKEPRQLLRSSSDVDFLFQLYRTLARLGVPCEFAWCEEERPAPSRDGNKATYIIFLFSFPLPLFIFSAAGHSAYND